tara:strand:- start:250 stop:1191 length:942 start_codon:yes stop_codon:yes gene_type:complete
MATTTTIATTYAGEKAAGYVAAALLSANTIENGGITVKPNVKFKEVLKRVSTDDILKNEICDFTATSTLTLSEKILQPETFQVNLQLCKADFRSDWDAIEMGYSAFDELPKSFADFLIGHVAAKVAAKTETNIWSGINANEGEFDGFQSLLTADAELPAAQKLTAVGGGVTPLNVVAELGSIVDALPTRLYGEEGLTLYVSSNIYRAYVRSLGGFGANGLGSAGVNAQGNNQAFGDLMFDGIPLFMCNGMSDDTSILTVKDNLFFGTSLLSDMQEVKVLDMSDLDGSQNVRVVMRMTAGVQYAFAGDVVTYGI